MNKNIKLILAFLVVLAAVLVGVFAYNELSVTKTPEGHLLHSYEQTAKERNYDISVDVKFDVSQIVLVGAGLEAEIAKEVNKMIDKASIGVDYKLITDNPDKIFSLLYGFNLNYDDNRLIDIEAFLDHDTIGFGMPSIYEKYFILNMGGIFEKALEEEGISLSEIDFNKYLEVIEKAHGSEGSIFAKEKYRNILSEYLKKNLTKLDKSDIVMNIDDKDETINVYNYNLDFSFVDYLELIEDFAEVARKDEDLKATFKNILTEVIELVSETKDYEKFDISEEDFNEAKKSFEDNFDDSYEELLDQYEGLADAYKEDSEVIQAVEILNNLQTVISIDKDHIIRRVKVEQDVQFFDIAFTCDIKKYGSDVTLDINKENTIDLEEFIDFENTGELKNEDKYAEIVIEIAESLFDAVLEGEGYQVLFDDLRKIESSLGFSVDELIEALEVGKEEIKNVDIEEVKDMLLQEIQNNINGQNDDYYDDTSYDNPTGKDKVALILDGDITTSVFNESIHSSVENSLYYNGMEMEIFDTTKEGGVDLLQSAIANGADLIVVYSSAILEDVLAVASEYPGIEFAVVETEIDTTLQNVRRLSLKEEEIGFWAGAVTGLATRTNKVLFVGVNEDYYSQNIEQGFISGVKHVNPDCEVLVKYAGTNDYDLGKEIAKEYVEDGVDIIYSLVGETGNGIVSSADELGFYSIGSDINYGYDQDNYLSTAVLDYSYIIDDFISGFSYDYMELTDLEYGIAYAYSYFDSYNFPYEIDDAIYDIVISVESGDLIIPSLD